MPKTKIFTDDYIEVGMRLNKETHKRLKVYAVVNDKALITCFDEAIRKYLKVVAFELLLQYRLDEIADEQFKTLLDRRNFEKGINVKILILPVNHAKLLLIADLKGIMISNLLNEIIIEYLENSLDIVLKLY